jgi:hypothetical protein
MPVDSPPLAVRAKGVKDAELLVTSLAIRTEQLLICVEDWGASSVSKKTTGPSQGLYFFFFVLIAFCENELPYDFK